MYVEIVHFKGNTPYRSMVFKWNDIVQNSSKWLTGSYWYNIIVYFRVKPVSGATDIKPSDSRTVDPRTGDSRTDDPRTGDLCFNVTTYFHMSMEPHLSLDHTPIGTFYEYRLVCDRNAINITLCKNCQNGLMLQVTHLNISTDPNIHSRHIRSHAVMDNNGLYRF